MRNKESLQISNVESRVPNEKLTPRIYPTQTESIQVDRVTVRESFRLNHYIAIKQAKYGQNYNHIID
jgi:hypothetical protein